MLAKARSINNNSILLQDIILDAYIDLACITDTWLGKGEDVNLYTLSAHQASVFSVFLGLRGREEASLWSIKRSLRPLVSLSSNGQV